MPTTTKLALPYLATTDPPDLPANNQALAEKVEAALSGLIQHGSEVVTGTGANYVEVSVVFDPPFPTIPNVVANYLTTAGGARYMYATPSTVSATGATFRIVRDPNSATFDDPRRMCWLAVALP